MSDIFVSRPKLLAIDYSEETLSDSEGGSLPFEVTGSWTTDIGSNLDQAGKCSNVHNT